MQVVLADMLFRALLHNDETLEENFDVNSLSIVPMSDEKLTQLNEATDTNPQLQQLSAAIKGLASKMFQKNVWNYCDELSLYDKAVF